MISDRLRARRSELDRTSLGARGAETVTSSMQENKRAEPMPSLARLLHHGTAMEPFAEQVPARGAAGLVAMLIAGLALAAGAGPSAAPAAAPAESYPRLMVYANLIGRYSEAERETLALFDMVSCNESPAVIAAMRARNPHQRIFYRMMPQNIVSWQEEESWWVADTLFSLIRLCQFYAQQNDWYLYDIHGERIPEWSGWAANWTRYCPPGVYGTSRGMTYAEWYARVAVPQIAYHSPAWERWGWGSSAYDGLDWEIFNDCPACCIADQYLLADPDRDGQAEGIASFCWEDGWMDSLSVLRREVNEAFFPLLREHLEPDLVLRINTPTVRSGPSWAWDMHGLKLENWRPDLGQAHADWWDWFYGRRDPQGVLVGSGYLFAEERMEPFGVDEREGWDATYIEVRDLGRQLDPSHRRRLLRWGLGTSMLGDGCFAMTHDQRSVWWFPEYAWEFGAALEPFGRELHERPAGGDSPAVDTLYVRRFEQGFVEVNPGSVAVAGVPAQDARFGFWQPIDLLELLEVGPGRVTVRWTAPASPTGGLDSTALRFSPAPISVAGWETAQPVTTPPAPDGQGGWSVTIEDLAPGTLYHVAARNRVFGRWAPVLAAAAQIQTAAAPPDTMPPAAVADLLAVADHADGFDLEWTAPGDDGHAGTAAVYTLGCLPGREIVTEGDWQEAPKITVDLPPPEPAGTVQSWTVGGLEAETLYGLCLRAADEAGNLGAIGPALLARTLPPGGPGPGQDPDGSSLFEWRGPFPHPLIDAGEFELVLSPDPPGPVEVRAQVHAVTGERVRLLLHESLAGGTRRRVPWDGRNERGRPVAPGLYFVKVEVGGRSQIHKLFVGAR